MKLTQTLLTASLCGLLLVTGCQQESDYKSVGTVPQTQEPETTRLKGRVTTPEGKPLKNAVVVIEDTDEYALTDENGHYRFSKVPVGKYKLTVSKAGFETASLQVESGVNAKLKELDSLTMTPKDNPNGGPRLHLLVNEEVGSLEGSMEVQPGDMVTVEVDGSTTVMPAETGYQVDFSGVENADTGTLDVAFSLNDKSVSFSFDPNSLSAVSIDSFDPATQGPASFDEAEQAIIGVFAHEMEISTVQAAEDDTTAREWLTKAGLTGIAKTVRKLGAEPITRYENTSVQVVRPTRCWLCDKVSNAWNSAVQATKEVMQNQLKAGLAVYGGITRLLGFEGLGDEGVKSICHERGQRKTADTLPDLYGNEHVLHRVGGFEFGGHPIGLSQDQKNQIWLDDWLADLRGIRGEVTTRPEMRTVTYTVWVGTGRKRRQETRTRQEPTGRYILVKGGSDVCRGRCGSGCDSTIQGTYLFTKDCFDHDVCSIGRAAPYLACTRDILTAADDEAATAAYSCADDSNVVVRNDVTVAQACAASKALKSLATNTEDETQVLYGLRSYLAKSEKGREYINLYYHASPELFALFVSNPDLAYDTGKLLMNLIPDIQMLLSGQGKRALVRDAEARQARDLFRSFYDLAEDATLKADLELLDQRVLQQLQAGISLEEFAQRIGITP